MSDFWDDLKAGLDGGKAQELRDAQKRKDHGKIDDLLPRSGIPGSWSDSLNDKAHSGERVTSWDLFKSGK